MLWRKHIYNTFPYVEQKEARSLRLISLYRQHFIPSAFLVKLREPVYQTKQYSLPSSEQRLHDAVHVAGIPQVEKAHFAGRRRGRHRRGAAGAGLSLRWPARVGEVRAPAGSHVLLEAQHLVGKGRLRWCFCGILSRVRQLDCLLENTHLKNPNYYKKFTFFRI